MGVAYGANGFTVVTVHRVFDRILSATALGGSWLLSQHCDCGVHAIMPEKWSSGFPEGLMLDSKQLPAAIEKRIRSGKVANRYEVRDNIPEVLAFKPNMKVEGWRLDDE
jgi:hypothetical protein